MYHSRNKTLMQKKGKQARETRRLKDEEKRRCKKATDKNLAAHPHSQRDIRGAQEREASTPTSPCEDGDP